MAMQVPSRLYRSRSEKMIAGVCGGLGEYFDVDRVLIRLLFVALTLISGGLGLVAYVILWVVVPRQGDEELPRGAVFRGDVEGLYGEARQTIAPRTRATEEPVEADTSAAASSEPLPTSEADAIQYSSVAYEPPTHTDDRRRRRQHWAGAILIILGAILTAGNLGLLWWLDLRLIWPLALVGIGVWLLIGRRRNGR
jgi:phage shock protein C